MALYHKDLGIPSHLVPQWGTLRLRPTKHCARACVTDRYGRIRLPKTLDTWDTLTCELIEVRTDDATGAIDRALYRIPYNVLYDLCLVVTADGAVITCWLNDMRDTHKTVKYGRYTNAPAMAA